MGHGLRGDTGLGPSPEREYDENQIEVYNFVDMRPNYFIWKVRSPQRILPGSVLGEVKMELRRLTILMLVMAVSLVCLVILEGLKAAGITGCGVSLRRVCSVEIEYPRIRDYCGTREDPCFVTIER